MTLSYKDAVDDLLAAVPVFGRISSEWDRDLPHEVFGTFALRLCDAIRRGDQPSLVEPGLRFLEQMANSVDDDVVNLLVVSVLEILVDEPACRQACHEAGGEKMRALLKRVAEGWRPAS